MTVEYLNPTHEVVRDDFTSASRLTALKNKTVVIISNGKKGTVPFFDTLASRLFEVHSVAKVIRLTKGNFSAPAERTLWDGASEWDAAITGVGD